MAALAVDTGIPPWEFTGHDDLESRAWWFEQMVGVIDRRNEEREG